ncbi:MAG: Na(+)-translocating NADH-quinone reductase subunit C [Myxococcota bacterium]
MPESDRQNSVPYIVAFATTVCLGCAVVVAGAAVGLKPLQEKNQRVDQLTKVLEVAGLLKPGEDVTAEEIIQRFEANIEPRIVDLETGAYDDSIDAATYDQRRAAADPALSAVAPDNKARVMRLPKRALVYHVKKEGSVDQVILPIQGYGLWSTMYGYIAMKDDAQTINGITFYEHGETPGLGGEIENPRWQARWRDRKAYASDGSVAIKVVKGAARGPDLDPYKVDGLSGATITSRGVTNTLEFWLGEDGFGPYLSKFRTTKVGMAL